MQEADRGRVWRLYGWYSALMSCGSCVGALAWTARMMNYVTIFKSQRQNAAEKSSLLALADSWNSAFFVTYAVEFLCLSAAKLMVLDRMSVFAAPEGTGMLRRWAAAGRIVMAVVVLCNAAGIAANIAAAIYYQYSSAVFSAASAYYAANNTEEGDRFRTSGREEVQRGSSVASVQRFCEVAVLLLIVAAFVAVGVLSARRVSSRLRTVGTASAAAGTGRALRLQIAGTTAFVFVAFLIRCVLSTTVAVAYELRDLDDYCRGGACDASCQNVYSNFVGWLLYMPAVEPAIALISSPVALLVALWGMTPKSTLQLMRSGGQQSVITLRLIKSTKREKEQLC